MCVHVLSLESILLIVDGSDFKQEKNEKDFKSNKNNDGVVFTVHFDIECDREQAETELRCNGHETCNQLEQFLRSELSVQLLIEAKTYHKYQ